MKKVLVIDDTPEIRMIIEETLDMFGFGTVMAEDGERGVEMARQHLPDLIICDVNMPKLDGFGTLTKLREDERTATIPFIFLSGAVERPNVRRGMELGADDYLTKPFTPSELLAAVNARLEKQAELERKTEKKLDEFRGQMTLALPHELRTPLNGIMGLAQIFIEDHAVMKPAEILENARFIHLSAERLHRLIENFLAYAQIELMAKDAKAILSTARGSATASGPIVANCSRAIAARWKRETDLKLDVRPCTVPAIADNLQKIVEELVDNAFKFSEPGTSVRVLAGAMEQTFSLNIINTGRGMTAEQIAKVGPHIQFEREKYEQQGAGLGLAIARRLTELNGGHLSITSTPGQATKLTVTFPMSSTAEK
ncbi:MAG TPA: hybrid sensor histidine kinase/response regulator [Methylomirabilota bacterium]|nr:hybrid sensor histidine kinase/response regulator [Methylomirabilota bacterium]